MKKTIFASAALCVLAGLPLPCAAQMPILKPARDLTSIRAAGANLTLLNTIIEANNAHPIEIFSFFQSNGAGAGVHIPFEEAYGYKASLETRRGADCATSAVRFLILANRLRVVHAQRKGDWFDNKPATLIVFELARNSPGLPGTPDLYFKELKRTETSTTYCDMDTALERETSFYN